MLGAMRYSRVLYIAVGFLVFAVPGLARDGAETTIPLKNLSAQEIREVNDVARNALSQVRSAVTGYRAAGLSAEFEAMHRAFDTAGVTLEVEAEPVALPPAHENALALVVREASTNVLRHAHAKTCRVRLVNRNNAALLEIVDDGLGSDAREGNGLLGMRERVASLGGSLVRDGRSGMRLEITLPLSPAPA